MDFTHRNGIGGFFYIEEKGLEGSLVGIITLAQKPDDEVVLEEYNIYDKSLLAAHYKDMIFWKKI